jgi:uncharacterized protein YacL
MMRFIRILGGALGAIMAISLAAASSSFFDPSLAGRFLLIAWIGAWVVVGYSILPHVTVEPAGRLMRAVSALSTGEFLTATAGLLLGLLMGLLLGLPLANLPDPYGWLLPVGVSIVLGLGMMGFTVAKRHDLAHAALRAGIVRQPVTRVEPGGASAPVIYVDTSAIIDGRMADVVAAGFLYGTLVVPRFVLGELQHIADQSDRSRRSRGQRGLEILSLLQKDPRAAVEFSDEDAHGVDAVDAKLVALAQRRDGAVLTTDHTLARVAQLQGVRVLNLNHLANALKPAFIPGEELTVKVIQEGKEPGQGVAFLDDGTMIVVEGGGSLLQRELVVRVTRVLQTVAGRMVFAQPRP